MRLGIVTLAALLPLGAVAGCGGSQSTAVKANGCTAVTAGTTGGRDVVVYRDETNDPIMRSAIARAVAAWNAAPTHVMLKPGTTSPAITFVAAAAPTTTTKCTGHAARTSTITLDTDAWHGTNGKSRPTHPVRDVSLEIGHALGLTRAGDCDALMTKKKDCSTYRTGPDPQETAEINKLYKPA